MKRPSSQLPFSPSFRVPKSLLSLLSAGVFVAIASADQAESVVTVVEGNEPRHLRYGDRTGGGGVSPGTDIDTYTFDAIAGQNVRIVLESTSGGWDPQIEILDPVLSPLSPASCSGGCCYTCSAVSEWSVATSGMHILKISDVGGNSGGSYNLQIELMPSLLPTVVECNTSVSDAIQTGSDTDFFEFEGVAGALIQLNFQSTSGGWDPRMHLLDPAGSEVGSGACNGGCCYTCSFAINTQLAMSGRYKLTVYDAGFNSGGTYQFTLQFVTGCPGAGSGVTPYCFGDGTATPCPCGPAQAGDAGHGCKNSFGTSGLLTATGDPSVSNDNVQFQVSGLPPAGIILFVQAVGEANAGLGYSFGDGLLCVKGTTKRLGMRTLSGGSGAFGANVPGDPWISVEGNLPTAGGTRYYQGWYRNPQSFCTSATVNYTNALRVGWRP